MKIGIDISGFTSLIGAYDFISNIIIALSANAQKNGYEIFLIYKKDKNFYKKYSGLKKIYYKFIYLFKIIKCYEIIPNDGDFCAFQNLKIIKINRNYKKVIKRLHFDCVLPITNPKIDLAPIPIIRYLYDCQHKYYPQFFSPKERQNRDIYFKNMVKKYCIVNSKDVKNDLIKFYNADKNKIFSLPFTPKLKKEYIKDYRPEIIEKYKLPKKYFLMSCQFWIHKDHPTLFKAFAKLLQSTNCSDINLVCTGTIEEPRKQGYITEIRSLIKNLGIEKNVYLLGCVPKDDQLEIMKKSLAVINTTLFEGGPGGGSIWDSCALGVRSIISDIRVNLEIKNDLVHFFKTGDADDLCIKMIELLSTPPPVYSIEKLISKSDGNIALLGDSLFEIINTVINESKGKIYEQKY